jgi:vacuolar-type H+-ATPase subunit C/Vma6
MASLQCEKKLRALDGLREQVQAGTKALADANSALLNVTKQAMQALAKKAADPNLLKAFSTARTNLDRSIGDLESKLNNWASEHRKLVKEILDVALDKAKREKNKDLEKSCAPVAEYFDAAEQEINSVRTLIESAKVFLEKNKGAYLQYVFQG